MYTTRFRISLCLILVTSFATTTWAKSLTNSTVCIKRVCFECKDVNCNEIEKTFISATAWFYKSGKFLVTARHVASGMGLTSNDWSEIELWRPDATGQLILTDKISARSYYEHSFFTDGIAILELERPVQKIKPLKIRTSPLLKGERLKSLGFFGKKAHFAEGRFLFQESVAKGNRSNFALFEMRNREDIAALDYGSSGAPLLDWRGNVVAIATISMSYSQKSADGEEMPSSAPRGEGTNKGVPLSVLRDFKLVDIGKD